MRHNKRFYRSETDLENLYKLYGFGYEQLSEFKYDGYIKCKLAHSDKGSIIIPELIIIGENKFNWIQHFSFFANILIKQDESNP